MSVLKGEGKVPILFGTASLSVGPVTRTGYLARPDLAGEWPTVVAIASAWGVTSAMKDVCRRIARQGIAVVAPDVYDRAAPPPRDASLEDAEAAHDALDPNQAQTIVTDVISFITNPAGAWSSAEHGFGILGLGSGGVHATAIVAGGRGDALALAYAPVAGGSELWREITAPVLGLYGRDDELVPVDEVLALRAAAPHLELALYDGIGHNFLDDYLDKFDLAVATDAIERIAGFFGKHLPAEPG